MILFLTVTLEDARKVIERQAQEIAELTSRIAALEERLNKTSKNSNKPPSTDSVFDSGTKVPDGRRTKRRRRKGGTARTLLPSEAVTTVEAVLPEGCRHCGDALGEEDVEGEVWRHQVIEIPEPTAEVTEYQMHAAQCSHCRRRTRAQLPEGVGHSPFGPRLTALVAMWSVGYRLSKRQIQTLLQQLWGIEMSRGAISACEQRMSHAIAEPVDQAHTAVQQAEVVYADETPWKQQHKLCWVWAGGTEQIWVFLIRQNRSKQSAHALLGADFCETLVADDYGGYAWVTQRQQCWSHLVRRFVAMSEFRHDDVAQQVGHFGRQLIPEMTALYRAYRDRAVTLPFFRRRMKTIRKRMTWALRKGSRSASPWTRSKCNAMITMGDALWAFVDRPDSIEPTNNRAERAVRHAVLYRKVSLGTQSEAGSRFVQRMLTVTQTLKVQGRDLLAFLHDALLAPRGQRPSPSLLPAPEG